MADDSERITTLLRAWSEGQEDAAEELVPLVYPTLRRIAEKRFRDERRNHTLQPTALVNEAYLRLVGSLEAEWESRAHFFGIAARMMRNILVDHARKHRAAKRGGGSDPLPLFEGALSVSDDTVELLALDRALHRLDELDERAALVVELKFFGGLTIEEISEIVGSSTATVKRDWKAARAFLFQQLQQVLPE